MKYIIRLLVGCFSVSFIYVAYMNRDLLSLLITNSIANFNMEEQVKEVVNKPVNIEDDILEVVASKSTLNTIFTYLPFLNINVENVATIKRDLPIVDAVSFELNSNVYEVYEVNATLEGQNLAKNTLASRVLSVDGVEYLAISIDNYIICVKKINDGVALLKNYQEGLKLLETIGVKQKNE